MSPEPDIVFRSPTHPWPSQWLGEGPLRVVSEAARPAKSPRARGGVRGARWGEPHTVTLGLKPFRTRRGRRPAVKQARRRRFQAWCRDEILRRLLTDVANELRDRGALDEEECFIDATFVMAKGGGAEVGATKRGKGMKIMAIVDRHGLPLSVLGSMPLASQATSARFH